MTPQTHVDAGGVEGTVVGRNGRAGVHRQRGAVAAPDQVRAPAVHREGDGQRQPHAAGGGQEAAQQGDAQHGPVLQAAREQWGRLEHGKHSGTYVSVELLPRGDTNHLLPLPGGLSTALG